MFSSFQTLWTKHKFTKSYFSQAGTWDKDTSCDKVEGPCELFTKDEIMNALRMMNKGKAAE